METPVSQGLRRWADRPDDLGEIWQLQKGRRRASCRIWTHPLGWELRLTLAGETIRTEVIRDQLAVLDTAEQWKQATAAKGWTADSR